jgi:hypothetical protein
MSAAPDQSTIDVNSPKQLKAQFKAKLTGWGLDTRHVTVLDQVLENWLQADAAEDIDHFRQRIRRKRGNEGVLDDLVSRQLVTHSDGGKLYEPKVQGFCLLLANGSRNAVTLRSVMDALFRLVRKYLDESPPRHSRSLSQVQQGLREDLRPLLIPAIKLLAETSVGISLGSPASPNPDVNFTDSVLRYSSPNQLAWTFLENYQGTSWPAHTHFTSLSLPFDLARLQIAPEVHASATKAVGSLPSSPDTAVSHARAALESTFKHVLGPDHPQLQDKLPRQASAVRDLLQFEGEFSDLGSRLVGVMEAIGVIRNKFGDSHGRAPGDRGATRPEAQLTVGTALLLCEFLLERWEAVRSLPRPSLVATNKRAA